MCLDKHKDGTSRIISGTILARKVYIPRATQCYFALSNPLEIRLLAKEMHAFNDAVASNPRLSSMIIPLRDGLTIIRYNP